MALSNTGVVEVRTTGSDNNGGGFKTGASGTDFSQQNAAQFALTGVTSVGAGATFLTATAAATMVGNYVNVVSGTNYTVGIYEITSVSVGVSVTVDRNLTTGAGAAGVLNIGGALATIGKALGILTVTGMQCYVKATATYSIASGLSTSSGINTNAGIIRLIGYTTTRGDNGQATIQLSAAATMITENQGGFRFENFTLDGNSKVASALSIAGNFTVFFNNIIKNFAPSGAAVIALSGTGGGISQSQITANTTSSSQHLINMSGTLNMVVGNYINANSTASAAIINIPGNGSFVEDNIFDSNLGSSAHVIINSFYLGNIRRNVFYNNIGDGVHNAGNYGVEGEISNNIFVSNSGWGINENMSPVVNDIFIHHNAFYNNTSGARNNTNAGTGDVTLTGVPFINAGGGNFALNNTASQGLACRQAGYPGIIPSAGTGYNDIGALQSQENIIVCRGNTGN